MLLEQHLAELFGNLPYLPMMEIVKHLQDAERIRLAVISKNWSHAIRDFSKTDSLMWLHIITKENGAEVKVHRTWQKLSIELIVQPGTTEKLELQRGLKSIIWSFESFQSLQKRLHDIISYLLSLIEWMIDIIKWNFDFGFSLEYLKSLNINHSVIFELKAEKSRVNGAELEKFVRGIAISRLKFEVKTIRSMRGGAWFLNRSVFLEDSRWVTGDALLENFNSNRGRFKRSRLNSGDFNRFLKAWKTGKRRGIHFVEFQLEQSIDKEQVIKGLDAKSWDPKVRSRRKDEDGDEPGSFEIYDLADGLDICTVQGTRGTVFLSENRKILRFHVWWDGRFPLKKLKKLYTSSLKSVNRNLKSDDFTVEYRLKQEERKKELSEKIRRIREAMHDE